MLNKGVHERGALQFAAEIDLGDVPICQLCLLELAWEIRDDREPSRGLIKRTVEWIWSESGESLKEAVVRARMDERPYAEEALYDVELNGRHGRFAEAVVMRLAVEMAADMEARWW